MSCTTSALHLTPIATDYAITRKEGGDWSFVRLLGIGNIVSPFAPRKNTAFAERKATFAIASPSPTPCDPSRPIGPFDRRRPFLPPNDLFGRQLALGDRRQPVEAIVGNRLD